MFLDAVNITVESGKGGDGISSFRKEKYVEYGGPYGGSGGNGGNIIFVASKDERTLIKYRYEKLYQADNGENGRSKAMHGANAKDLILKVPVGTIIETMDGELIADLKKDGDEKIVLIGGRGGKGNYELARSGQGHLELSENGEPAKSLDIKLNLKVLADAGVIGLPSVGKSTFLARGTNAKPKIAAYHFTTLVPNLGIAYTNDNRSFVIADMPGLIEGASEGKGLGQQFLEHIQRTRVLVHILDMGQWNQPEAAIEAYRITRDEIGKFDPTLLDRPEIVIANKKDLPDFEFNLEQFKLAYPDLEVTEVSVITDNDISKILNMIADELDKLEEAEITFEEVTKRNYTFVPEQPFKVLIDEAGVFHVTGDKIQRLVDITNFSTKDNTLRFFQTVRKMGIEDELRNAGCSEGDQVDICGYEFEFID